MRITTCIVTAVAVAAIGACAKKPETDVELVKPAGAPLFAGLDAFHRTIDTRDIERQHLKIMWQFTDVELKGSRTTAL